MTPSRLQARAKNCRGRWLMVMDFGAQAPNEGCGCPCADDAKSANSPPRVTGAQVAATGSFGRENDQSLVDAPDVYFEAGDHQALVHVSASEFLKLMANAPRGQISHHA